MRKRPRGRKYRNLTARGGVIYYQTIQNGKRTRISTRTDDWDDAAATRDALEARDRTDGAALEPQAMVTAKAEKAWTVGALAEEYLAKGMKRLARTSKQDQNSILRVDGPVVSVLGSLLPSEITQVVLNRWWLEEVDEGERSRATGQRYLSSLSQVIKFGRKQGYCEELPGLKEFQEDLSDAGRTQRERAAQDPSQNINPIEDPKELVRLERAARAEGPVPYAILMLLLDGGLRRGEPFALRWKNVNWGHGINDINRHVLIQGSRSRGGREDGFTKSGRARRVDLSKRAWQALRDLYEPFHPGPGVLLFDFDPSNFARRSWRRVCERAGLRGRQLKDLRDTYACHLLTVGVQLGYISKQLGHGNVAVTAEHYAQWCGSTYRVPMIPRNQTEVAADFLARIAAEAEASGGENRAGGGSAG